MARSPQGRYTSALSFARALQKVERELGLEVTNIDVLDNGFSPREAPEGGGLSLHPAAPIDPSLPTMAAGPPTLSGPAPAVPGVPGAGAAAADVEVPIDITLLMHPAEIAPHEPASPSPERSPAPEAPPAVEAAPGSDRPGPDAALVLEQLAPAIDASPSGPPAPRRAVWPTVLVDLVLVSAVAGAAAVYLLMQQ
jgi:hypothetical protein